MYDSNHLQSLVDQLKPEERDTFEKVFSKEPYSTLLVQIRGRLTAASNDEAHEALAMIRAEMESATAAKKSPTRGS